MFFKLDKKKMRIGPCNFHTTFIFVVISALEYFLIVHIQMNALSSKGTLLYFVRTIDMKIIIIKE